MINSFISKVVLSKDLDFIYMDEHMYYFVSILFYKVLFTWTLDQFESNNTLEDLKVFPTFLFASM